MPEGECTQGPQSRPTPKDWERSAYGTSFDKRIEEGRRRGGKEKGRGYLKELKGR